MKPAWTNETSARQDNLARLVAVGSLAIMAVLIALVVGTLGSAGQTESLAGTWLHVLDDGTREPIDVPFRTRRLDLPTDATVVIERTVALSANLDQPALLIEGVQHHLRLTWDGQILATMGDLEGPAQVPFTERLRVPLPPELSTPGDHLLRLTVMGDHGHGGLWGEVRIGQLSQLERHADGRTAESVALTAALFIASVLGLVISAVRPSQREFLWFGLFCAAACGSTFADGEAWWLVSSRLDLRLRVHAACYALIPGSGLLFVHHLVAPRARPWPAILLNAGAVVAIFSLLWGDTTVLPVIGTVTDIVAFAGVALGVLMLRRALLAGNSSVSSLMLAVGILVVAAAAERLSHELGAFDLHLLLPAFMLFLGTTAAALVLGRSDLADRYRQLVGSARDAIFVVLPGGTIEESNAAARVLLDRDPVGLSIQDIVSPDDHKTIDEHLHLRSGAVRRAELHLVSASGRVTTVESVATDLPEDQVMLVMRDITARRKVEAGMLNAARMETVGIIAGGIAHDFNNTMTALMAHIGLLSMKVTEDKDKERLQRMEAVIRRAAHMTRRLLTLARGGDKDRRETNPAEPIHGAVELTRSMLPRNVTIKERIQPDLPQVLCSADDLEQAVLNLLVNARDALAPDGGTIHLRLLHHREAGLAAGVRIEVEDDGPGIPEAIMSSIWEPFFTTKGEGRGTGLGLSVVARVIREHGGQITVRSVHAQAADGRRGTRFTIVLPTVEKAEPRVVDSGKRGQSVLVVDDEADIRELIRAELVSRGYQVEVASSAEHAMERVEAEDLRPDVLVTDVVMGGRDGISLAHQLCRRMPDLRVLVVSGFIPQHADDLAPSWQRLAKPFSVEELATALRRAILADPRFDEASDLPTQEV